MFNATDIPIRGFVQHVALHDGLMSAQLAALATRLVSGAPGFDRDKARLARCSVAARSSPRLTRPA